METHTSPEEITEASNEEQMIETSVLSEEIESQVENDLEAIADNSFSLDLEFFNDDKQEEKLWQARTGLNADTLCGAIETIVFMSDRPISINKIKNLIDEDMPLRVIKESIFRLQEEYEVKHHGIRLLEVAEGFQFRTKATYSKYVQDLFKVNSLVLSPTALEVLAIIAYKQPVSKVEVDKIRGVDSGHIVRALMDKRLVRLSGRSDEMGRPSVYSTTTEFLEVFNLASLDQLPPEHELESMLEGQKTEISEIKKLTQSGDKTIFHFDEIAELDELAQEINAIAPGTAFTKSLQVEEKKRKSENGGDIKTGFEILEEYILKKQIQEQNLIANKSELTNPGIDPQTIKDLQAGPFNIPQEEEAFEMIDLDTGEPIQFDADEDEAGPDNILKNAEIDLESAESFLFESDTEEGAEALNLALDEAFQSLTSDKKNEPLKDMLSHSSDIEDESIKKNELTVQEKSKNIDEITSQMAEKAKDLDLDLDFLNTDDSTRK